MSVVFLVFFASFGAPFLATYAIFCNWIFRSLLIATGLPKTMKTEYKRERFMTFIVFLSATMFTAGVLPLVITYICGIYYHLKQRRQVDAGAVSASAIPIIPRMALNELMVMVFSLAFFPVIVGAVIDAFSTQALANDPDVAQARTIATVSAFVIGMLVFPLCFASAYHRLEYHKIKDPRSRMAFLAIYPYMTFAMHILIFGIPIVGFMILNADYMGDTLIAPGLFVVGAMLIMFTGIVIGRRAVDGAIAAAHDVDSDLSPPVDAARDTQL